MADITLELRAGKNTDEYDQAKVDVLLERAAKEIEWLRDLLADKNYIQILADYQRGHLSYAGQLAAREHRPKTQVERA